MNRICIYMTHNTTNKLKAHVRLFLESMVKYADVYLVCNFTQKITTEELSGEIKKVFYRDNIGWDAGAFKDVLCSYLDWNDICKYEELLLINDSFYGPLYKLDDTFELFEKSDCDYWGMTGQEAGFFSNPRYDFDKHIHSYFLGFKNNIIKSDVFKKFWEQLEYPVLFREAVISYEININKTLSAAGFKGMSYIDYFGIELEPNENPYYTMPLELVEKYKMPILKKKCLLVRNKGFKETLKCIKYINNTLQLSVDEIYEDLNNQFLNAKLDGKHVLDFVDCYKRIYIYGHGVCGKNIELYLKTKNKEIDAFVTSSGDEEQGILNPNQMKNDDKTGVIISVIDPKISEEIKDQLLKKYDEKQLFLLYDCPAIRIPV